MKEKLENKREAIVQALANLKIDGISVDESYLLDYEKVRIGMNTGMMNHLELHSERRLVKNGKLRKG